MLIMAGLGNPGQTYKNNRHNIGFMVVDALYDRGNFSPWREKFHSLLAEGTIGNNKILLLKPQTFMNNSGQALAAALKFYKLQLADIIVFHDEMDIAAAKIRIKTGGGSGGHNGIKSIDAHCGKEYRRVRLGIGRPQHREKDLVQNYVMGNFSQAEKEWLTPFLTAIADSAALLAQGDSNGFMNKIFTLTHDTSANNGHSSAAKTITENTKNRIPKIKTAAARPPHAASAGTMAEKLKNLLFADKKT